MVTAGHIPHRRAISPFAEVRVAFCHQMIIGLLLIPPETLEENLTAKKSRDVGDVGFYYRHQRSAKDKQNLLPVWMETASTACNLNT